MQHLETGQLLGIKTERAPNAKYVYRVTDPGNGIGKEIGLTKGEYISFSSPYAEQIRYLAGTAKGKLASLEVAGDRIGRVAIPFSDIPRSRAVHPTQIYSSINALVLCLFLWCYWYVRRNDGEVMGLMLVLYPVSRFVLELIRNDEAGQFGTELTISQWVSVLTIACGIGLFAYSRMFGNRAEVPVLDPEPEAQ